LGNNAGRVPSLVRETSECPEAGNTASHCAYRSKAIARTVDSPPEIDIGDINDPSMDKNDMSTRVEQAEKYADRLRMELSEVKGQLDNAEMATAKLVDELLSSRRQLKAAKATLNSARNVERQLSVQIDVPVNDLEGSANVLESDAKKVEADLATLHSELEVVKSQLAGKISEVNAMKPELDLARVQLRIFQETYASRISQEKTSEMHAQQADDELAIVKAKFGAMNKIDVNQPTEFLADPGQVFAELNTEHPTAIEGRGGQSGGCMTMAPNLGGPRDIMRQSRLACVESNALDIAADICQLHETSLLRDHTQQTTGQDTGPRPSRDGVGRLSQVGCEADTKASGNPFEGYEDLIEAGFEDWNMDFLVARASSLATEADVDWLLGKNDVVDCGSHSDHETGMASRMSTYSCSSSYIRCSMCGRDSVPPVSLSDIQSSAMQTGPPHCCSGAIRSSLVAYLPTSPLGKVRAVSGC